MWASIQKSNAVQPSWARVEVQSETWTLFYQSRISNISVLALTRENRISHFPHTRETVYCWETGVHISAFNEVLLQLKLHWAFEFFSIYSTIYLASPNKKIYRIQTQKIDRCRTLHTHTTHNTQHNTQKQDEPLPPYPQRLCPISPWQHMPWPQIMVPRLPTSLLKAPSGGFALAAAGSLGWDAELRCIKK